MGADPIVSLRLINNLRLKWAKHHGEYRDLGGLLAFTSDAAIEDYNCLEGFTTDDRRVEGLLEIGFALLRAFDRTPCVFVTPLDRPRSLPKRLRARNLTEVDRYVHMAFRGDVAALPANSELQVKRVDPELARAHAETQHRAFGDPAWYKSHLVRAAYSNVLEPDQSFYLGYIGDEPVATALVVREGTTAGLYSIGTVRSHRGKGIATTMIARCVRDAAAAGCDLIGLRTLASADALRLYERLGFEPVHETSMWVAR